MLNPKYEEIPYYQQSNIKAGLDISPPEAGGCGCSCTCYGSVGKADDKSSSNDDTLKET